MEKVREAGQDSSYHKLAEYRCGDCGSLFVTRIASVESGNTKSCGCTRYIRQQETIKANTPKHCPRARRNHRNEMRARCKQLREAGKDRHSHHLAEYECYNCEKVFIARVADIESGNTYSCGCVRYVLQQETLKSGRYKEEWKYPSHVRDSPTFKEWKALGEDTPFEWSTFEAFVRDMWEAPGLNWRLGKINDDLPYSLNNCVWRRI